MFDRIAQRYGDAVCLVVGAGGIGTAIARLALDAGAKVAVVDFGEDNLARAQAALANRAWTAELDVRSAEACQKAVADVEAALGPIDFLFYAAGVLNIEPFLETTPKAWETATAVNLDGAFHCVQAAAKSMALRKRGSMLLLGSIAGTKARSGLRVNPVYNATKAGLAAMVNAVAMQLRRHGVRINCISPGPTATAMMGIQPESVSRSVEEIALDGRMNSAEDVAEVALFVAAHGRFTGEDVAIGGGLGLGG